MADFDKVMEVETKDTMTFVSSDLTDVNKKDAKGMTLLHHAVLNGDLELTRQLLDNGADVNVATYETITPLHCAVSQDEHLVELLLDRGADVNCQTVLNFTPLHYVVSDRQKNNWKMPEKFKEKTCPKLIDKKRRILKLLLNRGARIDQRNCRKMTCLNFAVALYSQEIVGLVLDYGANPNLKNDLNMFPLHYAVERQEFELVELLLQHGADVNVKDFLGKTPIIYAIENFDRQIFELLLLYDAKVDFLMIEKYFEDCSLKFCNSDKKERIFEILTEHVVKINELQNQNKKMELNSKMAELQKSCQVEVTRMKVESIYENCVVSFFDLLTHEMRRVEMYLNNEEGRCQLMESCFQVSFPNYSTMIYHRIKIGTQRLQLRNEAHELLQKLIDNVFPLPSDCSLRILRFFSDAEIKFFCSSHK